MIESSDEILKILADYLAQRVAFHTPAYDYLKKMYEQPLPFIVLSSDSQEIMNKSALNPFLLKDECDKVFGNKESWFLINNYNNYHWDGTSITGKIQQCLKASGEKLSCGAYTLLSIIKESSDFSKLEPVVAALKKSNINLGATPDVNLLSSSQVRNFIRFSIEKNNKKLIHSGIDNFIISSSLERINTEYVELTSDDIRYACEALDLPLIEANHLMSYNQIYDEDLRNVFLKNIQKQAENKREEYFESEKAKLINFLKKEHPLDHENKLTGILSFLDSIEKIINNQPIANSPPSLREKNNHEKLIRNNSFDNNYAIKKLSEPGHLNKIEIESYVRNLSDFTWKNIPMFAVVTGKNGIGKTALLEAIAKGFESKRLETSNKKLVSHFGENTTSVQINVSFKKDGVIPNIGGFSSTNNKSFFPDISQSQHKQNVEDYFLDLQNYDSANRFPQLTYNLKYKEFKETYDSLITSSINELNESKKYSPENNSYRDYFSDFHQKLRVKIEEEVLGIHVLTYSSLKNFSTYLISRKFSIKDINSHLKKNNFKYRMSEKSQSSNELTLRLRKKPKFYDLTDQKKIFSEHDLSPGENIELLILLWSWHIESLKKSNTGSLLLLDEFDAHLHPSLAREVIETIKNSLVLKYDIQVIMTTHNPTTVSLAPSECLYIISDDNSAKKVKIKKAKSKQQAIQLLTSDFVYVNEPFAVVFVEGEKDKLFYTIVAETLGNARIINMQILFKIHGLGEGNERSSCGVIKSLIKKITETEQAGEIEPLSSFVFGLIDGDNNNEMSSNNLKILERYSVENYVFDPINVFVCLYYIHEKLKNEPELAQLEPDLKKCSERFYNLCLSASLELNKISLEKTLESSPQLIINVFSNLLQLELKKALSQRKNNYKILTDLIKTQIDYFDYIINKDEHDPDEQKVIEQTIRQNEKFSGLPELMESIIKKPSKKTSFINKHLTKLQEILEQEIEKTNYDIFNLTQTLTLNKKNQAENMFSNVSSIFIDNLETNDKQLEISKLFLAFFKKLKITAKEEKNWKKLNNSLKNRNVKIMDAHDIIDFSQVKKEKVRIITKTKNFEIEIIYPNFLLYFRGHNLQTCYEKIFKIPHKLSDEFPSLLNEMQIFLIQQDLKEVFSSIKSTLDAAKNEENSKIYAKSTGITFFEELRKKNKENPIELNIDHNVLFDDNDDDNMGLNLW